MTVTDELLAELEEAASKATGGDWEYRLGLIRTMQDQDGYVPIAVAPNSPRNWRGQRDANMQHIAAANPSTITALTAELRRLRAENAELAKDAGRYRAIRNSLSGQQGCSHTEMPCISDPISPFVTYTPDALDTAIDTAMAAK